MDYKKGYDLAYEYYESARLEASSLEKKLSDLEAEVTEKSELHSRLTDFDEDDTIIFSPHSRYSDSIREKEEAIERLRILKAEIDAIKKDLVIQNKRVDDFQYILELIGSIDENTDKITDEALNDDGELKNKLRFLSSLLPADPMRVKIELDNM